jgi:hypothetical protein
MPHLERVADLQSVDREWREHVLNPKLSENQTPEEYWQMAKTGQCMSHLYTFMHSSKIFT